MIKYDFVIVGAGLSGATFAHLAARAGFRCIVLEKLDHPGGMASSRTVHDIDIHLFGPHIFHTSHSYIWEFVNSITSFLPFINQPIAVTDDGQFYNLPFNMNTFTKFWKDVHTPSDARDRINQQIASYKLLKPHDSLDNAGNFAEQALLSVGKDLYESFIRDFSEKQWGCPCEDLPFDLIKRIPIRFTFDNNYFTDTYQGVPAQGWDFFFRRLIDNVEIQYRTNYFDKRAEWDSICERIVFTGCIDSFFGFSLGALPYRTATWEHVCYYDHNHQGNAVINYMSRSIPYTRTIEHKHFYLKDEQLYRQKETIVSFEYPQKWSGEGVPLYPIRNEKSSMLFQEYNSLASQIKNVSFLGRMGQFNYINMDTAIHNAFQLFNELCV